MASQIRPSDALTARVVEHTNRTEQTGKQEGMHMHCQAYAVVSNVSRDVVDGMCADDL